MRRMVLPCAAAAAMALAVAAVIVLTTAGPEPRAGTPRLTAAATLSTTSLLFGDPLRVRIEVMVGDPRASADALRIDAAFLPYEVQAENRRVVRTDALTRLIATYTLSCLTEACLSPPEKDGIPGLRLVALGAIRVTHAGRTVDVRLPQIEIRSRLLPDDLGRRRPEWRSGDTVLPAPTFRVSPSSFSAALTTASAVLLAVAALLLAWQLRDVARRLPRVRGAQDPLERALGRVREATAAGEDGRVRRALGLLARELHRAGLGDLASDAEQLAWAPTAPSTARVEPLISAVARQGRGR